LSNIGLRHCIYIIVGNVDTMVHVLQRAHNYILWSGWIDVDYFNFLILSLGLRTWERTGTSEHDKLNLTVTGSMLNFV
jgi:hypothetical protein